MGVGDSDSGSTVRACVEESEGEKRKKETRGKEKRERPELISPK